VKGWAHPETTTGIVQRALTDEWQTQAAISRAIGIYSPAFAPTLTSLLARLVREGRAESYQDLGDPAYGNGGPTYYRRPQKEEA
jgi:hypothetical protein